MSVKSLFISTLSLTLRIGAVTHEKNQLIEQGNQEAGETKELAHHSYLTGGNAFHPTFMSRIPSGMQLTTGRVGLIDGSSRCITS